MPRAPRLTSKDLIRALEHLGFAVIRIRGSHHIMAHADGRYTVVPLHSGETIGPRMLNKILNDCHVSVEQLRSVL